MRKLLSVGLVVSLLSIGVVGSSVGCGAHRPPVLSPSASASLISGLGALSHVLQARGTSPLILALISDAQTAIADDVSGASWGEIARNLLSSLYSQLPPSIMNQTPVWASLAALEIVLATIGA